MRKEAAKFCNVSRSIGTKQEVTMTEKWLSEKEALEKNAELIWKTLLQWQGAVEAVCDNLGGL